LYIFPLACFSPRSSSFAPTRQQISDKSVAKNGDITSDMRNYISYARFYWPQPQVPAACKMFNGTLVTPNDKPKNVDRDLPFIRLSGCVNSRRTGRSSDKKKLKRVSLQLYILALAYKITGKLKYEVQATNIMKKFFTSSKYGMLPRFNFASWVVRSARNRYRGQGVREGKLLYLLPPFPFFFFFLFFFFLLLRGDESVWP
jgi:hypothetical protein